MFCTTRSLPFRGPRALVALGVAVVILAACSGGGHDTSSTPHGRATDPTRATTTTRPEPLLRAVPLASTYETPTRRVSHDGGVSVALPDGRALWLFGDTGIYERTAGTAWHETTFIDGSSAMIARYTPGAAPTGSELPFAVPARFLPTPDNAYLPDGSGQRCTYDTAAFAARWAIGATMFDPTHVLVTYSIVCITTPGGVPTPQPEGWGFTLYNWQTGRFDNGPTDVFAPATNGALYPPSRVFLSPRVDGNRFTVYSSECTKLLIVCTGGQVWSATMPATIAAISNPASYQPAPVATDGKSAWTPLSVSVGRYGNGLRLVELTDLIGMYRIYTTPDAATPWHLARIGRLPGCPTKTGNCIALEGHPELSSATRTFVSYKDPDVLPGGHLVISSLPT